MRGAALDITGPISGGTSRSLRNRQGLVTGAGDYWDAAHQNGELKRERKAMLQRMVEAKAIFQENQQLKAALELRAHSSDTIATGRIVGSSFNSPRRFAILSAGAPTGSKVGMPVRSADGLVGRIVDAGELASRVLLVSDSASIVPAACCATASRSLPRAGATARLPSARSRSDAIRSSAATSSSLRGPAACIRRWYRSRGS